MKRGMYRLGASGFGVGVTAVDLVGRVVRISRVGSEGIEEMAVLVGCADDGLSVLLFMLTVRVRVRIIWEIIDLYSVHDVCHWWEVLPEVSSELLVPLQADESETFVPQESGWGGLECIATAWTGC